MEYATIHNLKDQISRIGLGTWAIGGWLWGGSNEKDSVNAIHKVLDLGVNLIDTAPVYGFGLAEEIIGKALKTYGKKHSAFIATKAGLGWKGKSIYRDASKKSIMQEVEGSLKRLGVEVIDLYQVHWPDPEVDCSETAEAMKDLFDQGKIRAIGVCNFPKKKMQKFMQTAPLHSLQSPYNLFESDLDEEDLPFCKENHIAVLGYGGLCRGLLSGKMHLDYEFKGDDIRKNDPKFQKKYFAQYIECVEILKKWCNQKHDRSIIALAIRWCLDKEIDFSLWGMRNPEQAESIEEVFGWKLTEEDLAEIADIIVETITDSVGPEFMEPLKSRPKTV